MKATHTSILLGSWRSLSAGLALLAGAWWLPAAHAAEPVPAKRIYLGADDHTDYMWSGDEETYRQAIRHA